MNRIEATNLGKRLGGRWALRRLDLHVAAGEIVGIIGANGAGKSTLLKTLSGLLHPDEGNYKITGSMASLLEVGTGFHPDLSGRENAYLRGAMLGLTRRDVRDLLDDVATFAGVSERLDEPVKYYSSGMQVRLGFSLAAHLPTDVLVVDEVLAVGDAAFQSKSLAYLESTWRQSGRSVVYVAHQLQQVRRLCDRVLWLEHGVVRMQGPADAVCDAYLESQSIPTDWPEAGTRPGIGGVRATSLELLTPWSTGSEASLRFSWTGSAQGPLDVRIRVDRSDGSTVTLWSSLGSGAHIDPNRGCAELRLPKLGLSEGSYRLQLRLFAGGLLHDEVQDAARSVAGPGLWNGQPYPSPRPVALQDQEWT